MHKLANKKESERIYDETINLLYTMQSSKKRACIFKKKERNGRTFMKIKFDENVSSVTLQKLSQKCDLVLCSYSEFSKKDFEYKSSTPLDYLRVGYDEREKAPLYLLARDKETGAYYCADSVLQLREQLETTRLEILVDEIAKSQENCEILEEKRASLRNEVNAINDEIARLNEIKFPLRREIDKLKRTKESLKESFYDWKNGHWLWRFLYGIYEIINE
ncbi:TPA: hypothetical protein ACGO6G_001806 [Streptococcus suis]